MLEVLEAIGYIFLIKIKFVPTVVIETTMCIFLTDKNAQ